MPNVLTVSIGESTVADEVESAIADITDSAIADETPKAGLGKALGNTGESAIADEVQNSQRRYFSTQGSHPKSSDHPETPDAELEKVLGNTTESAIADETKIRSEDTFRHMLRQKVRSKNMDAILRRFA